MCLPHLHDRHRSHNLRPRRDPFKHHLLELNRDNRRGALLMQPDDPALAAQRSLAKDGVGRKKNCNFDWITRFEGYTCDPNVRHRDQGSGAAHVECHAVHTFVLVAKSKLASQSNFVADAATSFHLELPVCGTAARPTRWFLDNTRTVIHS